MLPGRSVLGRAPVTRPAAGDESIPTKISVLREDFEANRYLLAEVRPWDPDAGPAAEVELDYSDERVNLDTQYFHRLETAVNYTARIAIDSVTRPNATTAFGQVRIHVMPDDNQDFYRYYWDGRPVEILLGGDTFDRIDYSVILSGKLRDATWDDGGITLVLLDATLPLQKPLSVKTFAGTGGIEGHEDLANVRLPMAFGAAKNVTPVVTDFVNLVYQFHDGESQGIDAVYDSGIELTPGSSVADVFSQAPTPGTYDWELDRSVIRLGAAPAGLITMDVQGDATTALGGYVTTAADIAERMALKGGLSASDLNPASFFQLNLATTAQVAYYQPAGESRSTLEAMREVLSSVWGFVLTNRQGLVSVGRVELGSAPQNRKIPEGKVVSLARQLPPQTLHTLSLGYARSWTIQDAETLAGGVTAAHAAFVERELRQLDPDTDAAVESARLNSTSAEIQTLFVNASDAQAEQTRRFDLLKALRHVYNARVEHSLYLLEPGMIVNLAYTKFGLTDGKDFLVFSVNDDSSTGITTLGLWG